MSDSDARGFAATVQGPSVVVILLIVGGYAELIIGSDAVQHLLNRSIISIKL